MNAVIRDYRENTGSNSIVLYCNQLSGLWITYTSYQVIHKEKVAFELPLKCLNHTQCLDFE